MHLRALAAAMLLVGCAAPNTPGAGVGAEYTPVIDMQGVDGTRYINDLSACRQYAVQVDPTREMVAQSLGQALFAATIMQAAGGNNRQIAQSANVGANAGMWRGQGRALTTQQRIVANCLASRGYRVLDGTAQVTFTQAVGGPQPAMPPASLAQPVVPNDPAAPRAIISTRSVELGAPTPPEKTGQDSFTAMRLARDEKCHSDPAPKLVGKGPGYESYSVACANGETLMVRCEYGNCRALK